jgi:hypothetical protein
VTLVSELDQQAAVLTEDSDQTYEVAIAIASAAGRYAVGDSPEAAAAAMIRDAFGTWVQRIHAPADDADRPDPALAAHEEISLALRDWVSLGRQNPAEFGSRWSARAGLTDISWLERPGERLVRVSRTRRFLRHLRPGRR